VLVEKRARVFSLPVPLCKLKTKLLQAEQDGGEYIAEVARNEETEEGEYIPEIVSNLETVPELPVKINQKRHQYTREFKLSVLEYYKN
jgi:hypothetical protein